MTVAPVPVPAEIPSLGVSLAVVGHDANGLSSLAGIINATIVCDDPSAVFAFVASPDQLSGTLIPVAGVAGQATVTFSAGTTNADGSAGADVSAVYVAAVTPGNAVSVILEATDLTAPV